VIAAGGRLGGFGGSPLLKRELLKAEGILVSGTRVKGFDDRRWTPRPTAGRTDGKPASKSNAVRGWRRLK
jgi:hypothetical protein